MFTGIIETLGTIKECNHATGKITISPHKMIDHLRVGDSIAVNGVCLTIDSVNQSNISATIMPITLKKTNLGILKIGSAVNCESALRLNTPIGGHFVTGHIDGIGTVLAIHADGVAQRMQISVEPHIYRYLVSQGSVAIDGVSLTIAELSGNSFWISVVPHTAQATTLLQKTIGEKVNIESDALGKYLYQYAHSDGPKGNITKEFLTQHGF